ncbi:hypothetical protein QJS66_03660 [Kocuria rhizophila]|nr:hypothetical protein QJS66_03660 [Kocuria rhizophila]
MSRDASAEEIKRAYREKARELARTSTRHRRPRRSSERVSHANDVLSDPTSAGSTTPRAVRRTARTPASGGMTPGLRVRLLRALFETFFQGAGAGGQRGPRPPGRARRADRRTRLPGAPCRGRGEEVRSTAVVYPACEGSCQPGTSPAHVQRVPRLGAHAVPAPVHPGHGHHSGPVLRSATASAP